MLPPEVVSARSLQNPHGRRELACRKTDFVMFPTFRSLHLPATTATLRVRRVVARPATAATPTRPSPSSAGLPPPRQPSPALWRWPIRRWDRARAVSYTH